MQTENSIDIFINELLLLCGDAFGWQVGLLTIVLRTSVERMNADLTLSYGPPLHVERGSLTIYQRFLAHYIFAYLHDTAATVTSRLIHSSQPLS